jgi:hypothetical protein
VEELAEASGLIPAAARTEERTPPMAERFSNARVHEWLTPALDATAAAMHTSRLQLNSAALWWFLNQLSPEERAEALGEYTKALALASQEEEQRREREAREGRRGRSAKSRKRRGGAG